MVGIGPHADSIALITGVAWASGINLYAVILLLGLMAMQGVVQLPPDLLVLTHPWVIGAAGLMYLVEFIADKIPGVDSAWDVVHTFIRIPAGAVLAAGAAGQVDPALTFTAALVGGALTASAHTVKAGTRVLTNTSPEPFTNWALSIGEDLAVVAGMWTAVHHPWLFLTILACFVLGTLWLLPRLWRGISSLIHRLVHTVR